MIFKNGTYYWKITACYRNVCSFSTEIWCTRSFVTFVPCTLSVIFCNSNCFKHEPTNTDITKHMLNISIENHTVRDIPSFCYTRVFVSYYIIHLSEKWRYQLRSQDNKLQKATCTFIQTYRYVRLERRPPTKMLCNSIEHN